MSKYTTGPWAIESYVNDGDTGVELVITHGPILIAAEIRRHADAHLIAAAPDLLEACKAALIDIFPEPGRKSVIKMLEDAIAKAERTG